MLKKTITYVDYDGTERTEDFYFNLSKAELLEMELSTPGGLQHRIEKIMAEQNVPEIMKLFKDLLCKGYGEKSPDGKRFVKSEEATQAFLQTEAYSNLFMEVCTQPEAAAKFISSMIPADLAEAAKTADGPALMPAM